MLKKILATLLGLPKRIVVATFNRACEMMLYLWSTSKNVIVCLAIMPVVVYVVGLIMGWCGVVPPMGGGGMQDLFEPNTPWYMLVLLMLVVGCWEELYFRYLIMDCLFMKWLKMPYWLALVTSSASFGCAHLVNGPWQITLPQVVGAGVLGLWLARTYRKQGLHAAIAAHGCYNAVVVLLGIYFGT